MRIRQIRFFGMISGLFFLALGSAGCEGVRSDIRITPEAVGANCQYGGLKVETGHDSNENGQLDDKEVRETEYVCNQRVDGKSMAFDIEIEPAGLNCEAGGIKLMVGLDDDDNGSLESSEVDSTNYVCDGRTRLVDIVPVAAGSECEQGGVRVQAGYDVDVDGILDSQEVDVTVNVCSGRASLLKVSPVEEGSACSAGGVRVQSGFDVNGNQTLDSSEVQKTEYVCNGEDGYTSIVRQSDIAPNPNGACYYGGKRFESGLDQNRNGVLDPSEVEMSSDVCSVQVNERMTLIKNSVEQPGPRCEYGGIKTEVGIDSNNNQSLDSNEVTSTTYQCNQLMIANGLNTIMNFLAATSDQCQFGGQLIRSGLDQNRNGILEGSEVDETALICNGANGYNSMTRTEIYSGSECGLNGGYRYQTGLDLNRNQVLDPAEVQSTSYTCHGDHGFDGFDGVNSLIEVFDAGSACGAYGGVLIETGLDLDHDGILDLSEVENSAYVCNGLDGFNSLVRLSDAGDVCRAAGGDLVEVGLDLNGNSVLDPEEVESYSYICNGLDGYSSLIETAVDFYPECFDLEGMQVTIGVDFNWNAYIDADEVMNQFYICENWETYYP